MAQLLRRKRLIWGLIFLFVTGMAALSQLAGTRYLAAVHAVEHTLRVESTLGETLSLLKDAETGQRGFILTGSPEFLAPYEASLEGIPRMLPKLAEMMGDDPTQAEHMAAVRRLVAQKFAFMAETVHLRKLGDEQAALARVRSGGGKRIMDQIRAECRAMQVAEEARLEQRKRDAVQAERAAMWGVGAGSILTVLFALFSLVTVHRDVQSMRQTAEELAVSEEYYRLLTEHSSDLVRLLSGDGKVLYVNPSVETLLGYSVEEYTQLAPRSLMHPDEQSIATSLLTAVRSGTQKQGVSTYRIRHKSGDYRWFEVRWAARHSTQGALLDIHTVARDVTDRLEAEQKLTAYAGELRSLSLRDELTGLYNRRGFIEVAGRLHDCVQREQRSAALMFIDLNGMKRINDEQGHDIGDLALKDTAHVLNASLREADVVARLGGDEFVAYALDFTEAQLEALRTRLRERADRHAHEQVRTYRLSMSVGAAYHRAGEAHSLRELLDRADSAMYQQKMARRKRGGVSEYPQAADGSDDLASPHPSEGTSPRPHENET